MLGWQGGKEVHVSNVYTPRSTANVWLAKTNNYCKYLVDKELKYDFTPTTIANIGWQGVKMMTSHQQLHVLQIFGWRGVKVMTSHQQLLQIFGRQGVKPCLYTNNYSKCWVDKELNNIFTSTTIPKVWLTKKSVALLSCATKGLQFLGEMPPSTGFSLKEKRT